MDLNSNFEVEWEINHTAANSPTSNYGSNGIFYTRR